MSERTRGVLTTAVAILVLVGLPLFMLFRIPDLGKMTEVAHDAKVTDVRMERDGDDRYYTPTFTFEDSDHRTFEAKSAVRYKHGFRVGEVYQVRYDPYNPEAGCLIVGDDDRLRGRASAAYASLFIGIAASVWLTWKEVRSLRTSKSPDETSG